jgi:hypothetical protein
VIILNILSSFWYIFSSFGMLRQEKSGNPGTTCKKSAPDEKWILRSSSFSGHFYSIFWHKIFLGKLA